MEQKLDVEILKHKVTEKIIFSLRKDGIFQTACPPNTIMTLEDGLFSTKITEEMLEGKAYPLLCDLSNVVKMSKDCREHFSGPDHAKTYTVTALMVTNPIIKIIGNFFLGLNKTIKKTRLFTNKKDALEWLKQYPA